MFSGCEVADKKKMLMELGEIEKLHVDEECMVGLKERLWGGWETEYL